MFLTCYLSFWSHKKKKKKKKKKKIEAFPESVDVYVGQYLDSMTLALQNLKLPKADKGTVCILSIYIYIFKFYDTCTSKFKITKSRQGDGLYIIYIYLNIFIDIIYIYT